MSQGSLVGPFLFLIFINDLIDQIKNSKILLYADDAKLYLKIDCIKDCDALQGDLSAINEWCSKWGIILNTDKCHVITFTLKKNPIIYEYKIDVPLSRTDNIKDLGVTLTSTMNYSKHISETLNACFKIIGMLKRKSVNFEKNYCFNTI